MNEEHIKNEWIKKKRTDGWMDNWNLKIWNLR